jgi:hypothetical protein
MQTSINIDKSEIASLLSKMDDEEKKQALEDSGQLIVQSTHVGYSKETSPEGEKWTENPDWYKQAKGGAAILTGPTSKTIHAGLFAKRYEFANINPKRMRNSLMVRVEGAEKAYVEYEVDVRERASLTQYGGESKLVLKSTTGKKNLELSINVTPRPHLGVAEKIARIGGKTDPQHIEQIFAQMVDKYIG